MTTAIKNQGASAEAIQQHYDLSNEFYAIWLDSNMVYSGAMWQEGDSLEQAQIRKLDYHIKAADAADRANVLDIGCGWGAILNRLVNQHNTKRAVGLTLSAAQAEHVRAMNLPGVEVRLEAWQDHAPESPYDAIISIGAFEHFAQLHMTEAEKTSAYQAFFKKCRESFLVDKGYLSLQTFAYGSARPRVESVDKESTQFLANEIFRETDPPRLSNIATAIEGEFEIIAMHNDREGYAKTCKSWLDKLRENKSLIIKNYGSDVYDRYQTYLSYSFIGFKAANLDLYRIVLRSLPKRRVKSL